MSVASDSSSTDVSRLAELYRDNVRDQVGELVDSTIQGHIQTSLQAIMANAAIADVVGTAAEPTAQQTAEEPAATPDPASAFVREHLTQELLSSRHAVGVVNYERQYASQIRAGIDRRRQNNFSDREAIAAYERQVVQTAAATVEALNNNERQAAASVPAANRNGDAVSEEAMSRATPMFVRDLDAIRTYPFDLRGMINSQVMRDHAISTDGIMISESLTLRNDAISSGQFVSVRRAEEEAAKKPSAPARLPYQRTIQVQAEEGELDDDETYI